MVELTEKAFEAAESRGREMLANEPRASSARYDERFPAASSSS